MHKLLVLYKFEQYNVLVSAFSQHVVTPSRKPMRGASMAHNDHQDKHPKRKEIPSSLWVFALATFVLALPRIGDGRILPLDLTTSFILGAVLIVCGFWMMYREHKNLPRRKIKINPRTTNFSTKRNTPHDYFLRQIKDGIPRIPVQHPQH